MKTEHTQDGDVPKRGVWGNAPSDDVLWMCLPSWGCLAQTLDSLSSFSPLGPLMPTQYLWVGSSHTRSTLWSPGSQYTQHKAILHNEALKQFPQLQLTPSWLVRVENPRIKESIQFTGG